MINSHYPSRDESCHLLFLQLKSYITLKTCYEQNPALTIGILWFLLRGACVAVAPGEQACIRGVRGNRRLSSLLLACAEPLDRELGHVCSGAGCSPWPDGPISCSGARRGLGDCPQRWTLICLFAVSKGYRARKRNTDPIERKRNRKLFKRE